jgi:hypothetical protein
MHLIKCICNPCRKLLQIPVFFCLVVFLHPAQSLSAQIFFPLPTAQLSGSTVTCKGESASLTLSVSGYMPLQVVYTDGVSNYTISGINRSTHTFSVSPENTTTFQLVSVRDRFGRLGTVSGSAVVTVSAEPAGGSVTGNYGEILLTMSTGTLTLSGHDGSVLKWQKKINEEPWIDILHTRDTYSEIPATTGLHLYRAVVRNNCGTAFSEYFQIIVTNSPVIQDVNYDASNGKLVIYGQFLRTNREIDLTKLTVSNGEHSHRFTGKPSVIPSSATLASVIIDEKERPYLNRILNNNGLRSADNIPYDLSVEENWNGLALAYTDIPVALSGFRHPFINSAIFDYEESTLEIFGGGLVASNDMRDIVATKFTLTGKDNKSYTLTSSSPNVNVISSSVFTIKIGGADKAEIGKLIDIAGTISSTGHAYNLAAANGWNRPVHQSYDISDLTGNQVEAKGIVNQPPQATDADITGTLAVCRVLEATYEYFDAENDPEGETLISWVRAVNDSGNGEQQIHTGPDYTLALEDEGMFIRAVITPVARSGTPEGDPVPTPWYGPVENLLPTVSLAGPAEICQGAVSEIVFELSGLAPWTVVYTDGTNQYDFTTSSSPFILDISQAGNYRVTALVDAEGCQGTELGGEIAVNIVPTIVLGDWYTEIFDSATPLWVSSASSASGSWNYGPPQGDIFTSAPAGGNIWYTDIDPNSPWQSAVTSPCFDFSQSVRPMIAIDLWKEFGQDSDGAVLQYSLDNDNDWKNVGTTGQGINWYNSSQIISMPGGRQTGWTGTGEGSQGWTESRHDLDMVAGKKQVRLRIAYANDGSGESPGGLAFDNVRIGERTRLVLAEHFTNVLDEKSIQANSHLQQIAESNGRDIAYISYHTAFPPGDPLNSQNPADPAARALYYGISTVPYSIVDGGPDKNGIFDYSPAAPDNSVFYRRSLTDPGFRIDIIPVIEGSHLNLEIIVEPVKESEGQELVLHVAILETKISATVPGPEEQVIFRNVLRKLLPDAGGTILPASLMVNRPEIYNLSWDVINFKDVQNLAVVAFIQDMQTREIYQAGIYLPDMPTSLVEPEPGKATPGSPVFYPNPSKGVLYIKLAEAPVTDNLLEIFSLSGNLVKSVILHAGDTIHEINTAGIPRGMYVFVVRTGTGIKGSERIIIMD